jgi:hypothetical protein
MAVEQVADSSEMIQSLAASFLPVPANNLQREKWVQKRYENR